MDLSHTAIVAAAEKDVSMDRALSEEGKVRAISKWGFQGEYIHGLMNCPYFEQNTKGCEIKFFRFERTAY